MKRLMQTVALFAAIHVCCCLAPATAQVVPYRASGMGVYDPISGDYGGSGVATHLGRHTLFGNVVFEPTGIPGVFDFTIDSKNPQVTTAADGSRIFFSGSGLVVLQPVTETVFTATWSGNFVVEGGTGRFANVSPGPQPLSVVAINQPFTFNDPQWFFNWTLQGSIRLR